MRPTISVTTEVTTKNELNVSANVRQMLKTRLDERARVDAEIKERDARKKRIDKELDELLTKEGQGEALLDGVSIDGHSLKTVCGSTTKLNLDKLKRTFGLTQADIDSCSEEKDNTPYLRVTAPKAAA